MRLLAIESSCDETSAAVLSVDGGAPMTSAWAPRVESLVVSSQVELHRRYGGVVPELASRAHLEAALPAIDAALDEAGAAPGALDAIAVTRGPGLVGALLTGVETAKGLAWGWGLPLIGVHHLAGHVLAGWLAEERPDLPLLCLLVSGGHTALYLVDHAPGGGPAFERLGGTRDDAAGEAFDKGARMLGLPYPGGAVIDRLSDDGDAAAFDFPVAMQRSGDLDLSFSGLKTALKVRLESLGCRTEPPTGALLADLCASYQEAICLSLVGKLRAALEQTGATRLLIAGGVACNRRIRAATNELAVEYGAQVHQVPLRYCTDNAAMIGCAALAAPVAAQLPPGSDAMLALDADPAWSLARPFASPA